MKNPQLAMSMQRIMKRGHDFPKDKREGMLTLSHFGVRPCVMGKNPSKLSTTLFLVFLPNHLFCQKVVEVVIAWKVKSMGKFKLGRAPSFECLVLLAWKRKHENRMPFFASCVHVFG